MDRVLIAEFVDAVVVFLEVFMCVGDAGSELVVYEVLDAIAEFMVVVVVLPDVFMCVGDACSEVVVYEVLDVIRELVAVFLELLVNVKAGFEVDVYEVLVVNGVFVGVGAVFLEVIVCNDGTVRVLFVYVDLVVNGEFSYVADVLESLEKWTTAIVGVFVYVSASELPGD